RKHFHYGDLPAVLTEKFSGFCADESAADNENVLSDKCFSFKDFGCINDIPVLQSGDKGTCGHTSGGEDHFIKIFDHIRRRFHSEPEINTVFFAEHPIASNC